MQYSEEQKNIISESTAGHNIIIDSKAGSGKTTTAFGIALANPTKKILVLTYNSKLKTETRTKAEHQGIKNVDIHSYHSFGYNKYSKSASNDNGISNIIKFKISPFSKIEYDTFIIDECQDITLLYYTFFMKVYFDNSKKNANIILIGDVKQSIYGYNGADEKYLRHGNIAFDVNSKEWKRQQLSNSYRVPQSMCDLINQSVIPGFGINSLNPIKKSRQLYIISNSYTFCGKKSMILKGSDIITIIQNLLKDNRSDDIFILSPSLRSEKTPQRQLANKLAEIGMPIYVSTDDGESTNDLVLKDKICFLTFHQAKGLERKFAFVFNFDTSYFEYFNKNAKKTKCPNELYVALTRASVKTFMIHDIKSKMVNFMDYRSMVDQCDIIMDYEEGSSKRSMYLTKKECIISSGKHATKKEIIEGRNLCKEIIMDSYLSDDASTKTGNGISETTVTKLLRHLPFSVTDKCMKFIEYEIVNKCYKKNIIALDSTTKQEFGYESVSEINGTLLPMMYEYIHCDKITELPEFRCTGNILDKNNIHNLATNVINYLSNRSGYTFKNFQIKDMDWLDENKLKKIMERFIRLNMKDPQFEIGIKTTFPVNSKYNVEIEGSIDCVTNTEIYEFKYVDKLTDAHIIQIAIYAYLYIVTKTHGEFNKDIILYNLKNDEKIKIVPNHERLRKVLETILLHKCMSSKQADDDDDPAVFDKFTQSCQAIIGKFQQE